MIIDFSRQLHYVWALLPEIILCISGMAILVVGVTGKYREAHLAVADELVPERSGDLGWLALLSLLMASVANAWLYGVSEVGVNWGFLSAPASFISFIASAAASFTSLEPSPVKIRA